MCGLVGFLGGVDGDEALRQDSGQTLLRRMADTLFHRGPDDGGIWCDTEQRIGLGHRCLAIVDLSPAGHQPVVPASGRFVIAFNREIYNHLDLRKELEQIPPCPPLDKGGHGEWRGHSDTETLRAGIDDWCLEVDHEH